MFTLQILSFLINYNNGKGAIQLSQVLAQFDQIQNNIGP